MSEGVWGRPESPHSQPMIYQSIKNNVVYYNYLSGNLRITCYAFIRKSLSDVQLK